MRSDEQHATVLRLVRAGVADREIARRTGVPRATVGHWRRRPERVRARGADPHWRPGDPLAYGYVLGLYLGDGHIVRAGATARLAITFDAGHPDLIAEGRRALASTFPGSPTAAYARPAARAIELRLSNRSLPQAFPQCGPGKKHQRAIRLADWQLAITRANPKPLIRGLLHSDGCRTVNRFSTALPGGRVAIYEYPRYFFSNLSADIRGIFCEHCDLLGIRWTQSNPRNISISRRESVALVDEFVGVKT